MDGRYIQVYFPCHNFDDLKTLNRKVRTRTSKFLEFNKGLYTAFNKGNIGECKLITTNVLSS